jgi:spore germination protein GerM
MVYIDLNKAFVTDMNAGSGYESMILTSIANTFGQYYGVNKVVITIDGEPYSSGVILMKQGIF